MPQISVNDLARLRQIRQWSQIYMAIHVPVDIMTARVNKGGINRGARTIPFDAGIENPDYAAATSFFEGATMWVGTYAGGKDVGVVRIKLGPAVWPPAVGEFEVAENQDIIWRNNLYLTIKDEHRIWPKLPRVEVDESTDPATITWWKDYDIAHNWQTHQEPPVVIMGPPACAFINPTSGLATVNFWGNDSYSPRGTALSGTILWTFRNGTPATRGALGIEAAPHSITWDTPGVYVVRLAITDGNNRTSYGYRTVFIFSRDTPDVPYQNFEVRSMRGNFAGGGWSANIRVFGDRVYGEECDVEDFPEGTQAVIFAEDWYDGELVSIGGYGHRENIVFAGWLKADTIHKEPITGEVSFQMHTVNDELQNCPSFPQTVERVTGTPANWMEIQNMTIDLTGFYIGYWHSTLYDVVDVLQTGDTSKVKYMDMTQTNIYNLLDKGVFASTIFARALSDRQSRFKYDQNPQYLTDVQRAALATIMDLDDDDWLGRIDVQEIHEDRISWIDLSGVRVTAAEKQAMVFSLAPGDAPMPDGAYKQLTRLIIDDQDDGNFLAGRALADFNNPLPRTRVPLQGNYRIFDIQPQEWVRFPSLGTLREGWGAEDEYAGGTPWPTGIRFIPRNIDIGFRNDFGAFLVSMNMEAEVAGVTGTDGYYPIDPPEPPPPPPRPPPPPPPPPPPGPDGGGEVVIATLSQGVFRTGNILTTTPVWEEINDGLVGSALQINGLIRDSFYPSNRALLFTEDGIYRSTNMRTTVPTWTQVLSNAEINTLCSSGGLVIVDLKSSICQEGLFFALAHRTATQECYCIRSIDGGVTWTYRGQLIGTCGVHPEYVWVERANYVGAEARHGNLYVSSHDANKLWTFCTTCAGLANARSTLLYSPNQGTNWSVISEAASTFAIVPSGMVPYHDNTSDQRMYSWHWATAGTEQKSITGGATWGAINPPGVVQFKGMLGEHTWNDQLIRAIIGVIGANSTLSVSPDQGSSWDAAIALNFPVWAAAGFPYNQQLVYFGRAKSPVLANYPLDPNDPLVKITQDQGASLLDKSGNLRADFNVKCITTIVPDWTR